MVDELNKKWLNVQKYGEYGIGVAAGFILQLSKTNVI